MHRVEHLHFNGGWTPFFQSSGICEKEELMGKAVAARSLPDHWTALGQLGVRSATGFPLEWHSKQTYSMAVKRGSRFMYFGHNNIGRYYKLTTSHLKAKLGSTSCKCSGPEARESSWIGLGGGQVRLIFLHVLPIGNYLPGVVVWRIIATGGGFLPHPHLIIPHHIRGHAQYNYLILHVTPGPLHYENLSIPNKPKALTIYQQYRGLINHKPI